MHSFRGQISIGNLFLSDVLLGILFRVFMCGSVALLPGCSEEDTITEPQPGPPGSFASTPNQLMVNYQDALTTMNLAAYQAIIHPDYKFLFIPTDVDVIPLPTDHMLGQEELVAVANMFSGELIVHGNGSLTAAVDTILVDLFEPVDSEWSPSPSGSEFPTAQRRVYTVHLSIARVGNTTLRIAGQQEFFVTSYDSSLSDGTRQPFYQLLGQRELTAVDKNESGSSFGMAKLPYYTNSPPVAVLTFSLVSGAVDPVYRFDASESYDLDSGLHASPYRWRFGSRGEYTEWFSDPYIDHTYELPGEKTIQLQVRDRWNLLSLDQETLTVDSIFPDTEVKLIANFIWSLSHMDLSSYTQLLHQAFNFRFQNFDVERFSLPFQYLDRDGELEVAANTFAPESGITNIEIVTFSPLEPWVDSVHPMFPDSRRCIYEVHLEIARSEDTDLQIGGLQEFYVASRDSTVPGGEVRPYYELRGQVDWSNAAKLSRLVSWGEFKFIHMTDNP